MPIEQNIKDKIYTFRNGSIVLDRDLAEIYRVETKRVNEAVKNNPDKFPEDFCFELNNEEEKLLRSKISTLKSQGRGRHRKYPTKAFTEQGVYMLATILKSKVATEVTISIMRTFTKMKSFLTQNAFIFERFERIEYRLQIHDKNIDKVFKAIENKNIKPIQGIFFDGQIYDAYAFVNDLLKSAKKEIISVDNYIDDTVLTFFSKYPNVSFTIFTKSISKQLKLDIDKYNSQYSNLTIKISNKFHDRFLIIDNSDAYHIGASLKDLGNKVFGFSKIDIEIIKGIIEK